MSVNISSGLERDPIGHRYSHAKIAVDHGVGLQDTAQLKIRVVQSNAGTFGE